MDDILYYLLIGIGYALYSWLTRKRQPQPDAETMPPEAHENRPTRQVTFEELLREITQAKEGKMSQSKEVDQEAVVDYDEELTDEIQTLEEVTPLKESIQFDEAYESAKQQAFERPSLEETIKLKDTRVAFSRFAVFDQSKSKNLLDEYTADLHDPEGLKKAVVLSEILNRKYH